MTRLSIGGDTDNDIVLDFEGLCALPGQIPDIGALVAGREGGAVPLARVLAAARPSATATHVTLESTDGKFSASVPLDGVRGAIIAYRLGDDPLPTSFGGPLRFLIPDAARCGKAEVDTCANVKFLGSIEVTTGKGVDNRPSQTGKSGC